MEKSQQNIEVAFGFNWPLVLAQLAFVFWMAAAIYATSLAARVFQGWKLLAWVLVCWLVPIVGPLIVIICARNARREAKLESAGR